MIYFSPAKINLSLDILSREDNGFHLIKSVYQTVPLYDKISVDQINNGSGKSNIVFTGDESDLISKEDNTVLKAIKLLNEKQKFKNDYNILVEKNIPIGAGLGGGSSDAATIIKALNKLESMNLSSEEMRKIGAKIGADVPLFIEKGTSFGTHYGEKITLLPDLNELSEWGKKYKILVIPPTEKRKKTAERYASVDTNLTGKNKAKMDAMIKAINNGDADAVIKNMHNDFEIFAGPEFEKTKDVLLKNGALLALLCGSGTAVFAISNKPFDAASLSRVLPNQRILNLNQ